MDELQTVAAKIDRALLALKSHPEVAANSIVPAEAVSMFQYADYRLWPGSLKQRGDHTWRFAVKRHFDFVPARAASTPEVGIQIVAHVLPQHVRLEGIGIVGTRPAE